MASFWEHCDDCERLLGHRCEDVNRWMDYFSSNGPKLGPMHRFMRHHSRGVQEAEAEFGALGRAAAVVHILKDCGRIPLAREWRDREVDTLGILPNGKFQGWWDPQEFDREALRLLGKWI